MLHCNWLQKREYNIEPVTYGMFRQGYNRVTRVTRLWKIILIVSNEYLFHICYYRCWYRLVTMVTLVTKRLLLDDLDQFCALDENCLCSLSCYSVKNYLFTIKLLHANVKHVSIVLSKFQSYSWKTVLGVDRPMKALYICI